MKLKWLFPSYFVSRTFSFSFILLLEDSDLDFFAVLKHLSSSFALQTAPLSYLNKKMENFHIDA